MDRGIYFTYIVIYTCEDVDSKQQDIELLMGQLFTITRIDFGNQMFYCSEHGLHMVGS